MKSKRARSKGMCCSSSISRGTELRTLSICELFWEAWVHKYIEGVGAW